ncbi:hypothetical protein SDC9_177380 [bioreactor metagenome]|uniref:Uncharacterized protein n=1 Tax=bioreactor metagenome TaxID=1076179 RepID=A0A645GT40_9ZZZZ
MIENVRLDILIVDPAFILCETVNLNRDTLFTGLKLADYAGKVLINIRVIVYIGLEVCSEHTDIGLPPSVYKNCIVYIILLVIGGNDFFRAYNVILQIVNSAESLYHLGSTEFNTGHVYIDRPLNPPAL